MRSTLGSLEGSARYQNRTELLQGTLDFLMLQTVQWGSQHGYGISPAIRANSMDATGSRCPALHRLRKQKVIAAAWKTSDARTEPFPRLRRRTGHIELAMPRHSPWLL